MVLSTQDLHYYLNDINFGLNSNYEFQVDSVKQAKKPVFTMQKVV